MGVQIISTMGLVWLIGFILSGSGYYASYRMLPPSFWRCIAAIFWPIGIPLDFIFVAKRWPQRLIGNRR